ncbi:hypothetical protein CEXT_383071 [Caerostris extrusa]|uniref:Uncharacterized protein n=1 Tax=Caerostris extrusa TaxID=172846 RepID=A0AAV4XST6_CAEEX|nr:hypothetical protein CEXT_383071 [Caerostris extrusa]
MTIATFQLSNNVRLTDPRNHQTSPAQNPHINKGPTPHEGRIRRILREAGKETDEYQWTHSTTDRDHIIQKAIHLLELLPKTSTMQHLKEIEEEQNSKRPRTSDTDGFIPFQDISQPNQALYLKLKNQWKQKTNSL